MTTDPKRFYLAYGMGVDSTAILLRWCLEPASRPEGLDDLSELTVVTAMTGSEYAETYAQVDAHILPLLRKHGIRFVQASKADFSESAGIVVLDDSTAPERVIPRGPVTLREELERAGTIVCCKRPRPCTLKWKGFVLDSFFRSECKGLSYSRAIGFAKGEESRVERNDGYGDDDCESLYPLIEWGWDREAALSYIREAIGVTWRKSCCRECPYQKLRASATDLGVLERMHLEPDAAVGVVALEERALRLNPRLPIWRPTPLRARIEAKGDEALLSALASAPKPRQYTLVRVRRAYDRPGHAWRSIEVLNHSSHWACQNALNKIALRKGASVEDDAAIIEIRSSAYPAREEFYTIVPGRIEAKEDRSFAKKWAEFAPQLSLFGVAA